jgi:MFS transporter, DHA1 family, multidrug resistance protein
MVGIQTISATAFSISLPFLPLYIAQLGVKPLAAVDVWSGVVYSINFLMAALFAPMWGNLADRFGRKAMVVRSSIVGGISSALMGASPNVWFLTGARALTGIGGAFTSASTALVAAEVPENQLGFALGWMSTGAMIGSLIGPIIGGLISDALHDYRAVFYWTAGGTLCCALVCLLFVRERNFDRPAAAQRARTPIWRQFGEILRHPEIAPLFTVLILAQITVLSVVPVVPLFVADLVGPSAYLATFAGASFAVMAVGDLLASPFLGKRSDRIGYRTVLLISLAGAGLFTIPQGFVHNIWVFLALRFGVGLFLGGIIPTANAWIGRLFPAGQRGMVFGMSYSASFFGMFLGPNVGGLVAARFGITAVFILTGVLMLANVIWVARGVRQPANAPEAASHPA